MTKIHTEFSTKNKHSSKESEHRNPNKVYPDPVTKNPSITNKEAQSTTTTKVITESEITKKLVLEIDTPRPFESFVEKHSTTKTSVASSASKPSHPKPSPKKRTSHLFQEFIEKYGDKSIDR